MHCFDECLVGGPEFLRLQAENAVDFVRPGENVVDQVEFPAAEVGDLLGPVQPGLARAQGLCLLFRPSARPPQHIAHIADKCAGENHDGGPRDV